MKISFPVDVSNSLKSRSSSASCGAKQRGDPFLGQVELSLTCEDRTFDKVPLCRCPGCQWTPLLTQVWDKAMLAYIYGVKCEDRRCNYPKPEPSHQKHEVITAWNLSVKLVR